MEPDPYATVRLRPLTPADDAAVADLIRRVMTEFRLTSQGFAIHDPEVAAMSRAYPGGDARFYVLEQGGRILGCGGFGRLLGTSAAEATCELRKMYFLEELRGRGWGRRMLEHLLGEMREAGYRRCYLETTSWMDAARALYRKLGFAELPGPEGSTGHHGCNRFFARDL